jgi:predicted ATPase
MVGSDGPTDHPEMPRSRSDRAAVLVVLRGRRTECETLDALLAAVRTGESRALVLRGEPGVGKTALMEHLIASAPDLRLLRAIGVEPEMELAFAALQQLCAPLLDGLEELPGPQATDSANSLRATKASTCADASSNQCASSTKQSSGRSSLASDSKLSVARPTT